MGAVDAEALANLARTLRREEFVAKHSSLYLVIAENVDQLGMGFATALVTTFPSKPTISSVEFELLEVSKAPGNPYPERISIGRARNCDLVMRHPSVSKLHAHFRVRAANKLDLVDLGSQNGTFINGRSLQPNVPEWVGAGDALLFGAVTTKLVDADALYLLL
jgi:hypothetical protein